MRLLVCNSGTGFSTEDVHDGINGALTRAGHMTIPYDLHSRLEKEAEYLNFMAERRRAVDPDFPPPHMNDIVYRAGSGMLERALRHDVDWVLIVSGGYTHPSWLELLTKAGIRLGIVLTESPYLDELQATCMARYAEVCWTNERTSVPYLRGACPQTYYLPASFDATRHTPESRTGHPDYDCLPHHDVVFVGTGFKERIELLEAVDWGDIDFGLYGLWSKVPETSPLYPHIRRDVCEGPIDNWRAAELYRRAKVGLNLYRTDSGQVAESLNPRAYELAACGVPYVSAYRAETRHVFGSIIPTFNDATELECLLRGLLMDDGGRRMMRDDLPACVAGHSFDARVAQMLADMEWSMKQEGAGCDQARA